MMEADDEERASVLLVCCLCVLLACCLCATVAEAAHTQSAHTNLRPASVGFALSLSRCFNVIHLAAFGKSALTLQPIDNVVCAPANSLSSLTLLHSACLLAARPPNPEPPFAYMMLLMLMLEFNSHRADKLSNPLAELIHLPFAKLAALAKRSIDAAAAAAAPCSSWTNSHFINHSSRAQSNQHTNQPTSENDDDDL